MKIYEILEKIKVKQLVPRTGICGNFDEYWFESVAETTESLEQWEQSVNALSNAITLWPKNTGSELFPVPCPNTENPAIAYRNHWKAETMWSGSEYALKRIELLEWLIAHFRELDK